jgi:nucleotide-binding universal stress UspA family protein
MKSIVVPVDFSDQTEAVMQVARRLGEAFDAQIWLLHIAAPDPDFVGYGTGPDVVREQVAKGLREEHSKVQELGDELRVQGLTATALAIQGPTVDTILAEASKLEADLIIMGSHGHGAVYRTLMGSVSEGVLHRATCPVLIVPPDRDS